MAKLVRRKDGKILIFRRYRTTKSGQIADAWLYGYKAWPIWIDPT